MINFPNLSALSSLGNRFGGSPEMRVPMGPSAPARVGIPGQMPERPFIPPPVMPNQPFSAQVGGGAPPIAPPIMPSQPITAPWGGAPEPIGGPPVNPNPWSTAPSPPTFPVHHLPFGGFGGQMPPGLAFNPRLAALSRLAPAYY
jgi:hypothetical protein